MTLAILLALGLLTPPFVAFAQPPGRVPVVGVLAPGSVASPTVGPSREAFERGLREAGWLPGQTIRVEYRFAEGSQQRLHQLAGELVRRRVDVIGARASPSIMAAKQATTTIPIVMSATGQDPVQLGLVVSLARRGGNITGLTLLNQDLYVKHLEILKEVLPRLSRVAIYWLHIYPQADGLMSYGADLFDIHRRSALYVDRILRGARPADLPVEEPAKFC